MESLVCLPADDRADPAGWLERNGVAQTPLLCMGPLPLTGASVLHWSRDAAPDALQPIAPHPGHYHIVFTRTPVEVQLASGPDTPWTGLIGANRFCVCPPQARSWWRQLSPCEAVNILVPVATVRRLLAADGGAPANAIRVDAFTHDRHVADLVDKIVDCEAIAGAYAAQFCDGLVASLVSYLLSTYGRTSGATTQSALRGPRLQRLLARIAENMADALTVAELARQCGMSESHFSREFRSALGLPPHQYILRVRLDRACAALLADAAPIADIARRHGFASASHFARAFAARFGMPPVSYRRARLEDIASAG